MEYRGKVESKEQGPLYLLQSPLQRAGGGEGNRAKQTWENHVGRQKLRLILSGEHGDCFYYSSVYIRNVQNQMTFNYLIILVCACVYTCVC